MSYRDAFLFGWSIAWRQFFWSLLVGSLLALALVAAGPLAPPLPGGQSLMAGAFGPVFAILTVGLILPCAIRQSVAASHPGFRVEIVKRTPAASLTYADALQVSLLAMVVFLVLGGVYSLIEFPSVQLGLLVEVPLSLFVIYPAFAELAIYVPYRGFRLVIERFEAADAR